MKKILCLLLALLMMTGSMFAFSSCADEETPAPTPDETDKTLTCGVTPFAKMNEQDANGNWTGFESEFAMEVGKLIGMDVEFQLIDWSQKYNELNSGAIDCIWNGFTANSSDNGIKRSDLVDFSYGYMLNQQCIVTKTEKLAQFTDEASLSGKSAAAEGGSAGEAYAKEATTNVVPVTAQIDAFREVSSGAVDFIVVDILLAQNLCGKGNYADLSIVPTITLDSEIYAIGFKKGSDLTAKVNQAILTLNENGKLMELATKYGFENVLKVSTEPID